MQRVVCGEMTRGFATVQADVSSPLVFSVLHVTLLEDGQGVRASVCGGMVCG